MPGFRLILSLLVLAMAPAHAQDDNPFADNDPIFGGESQDTTSELLSDTLAIAPGEPFTLSLKLTHPVGWHSYFKNDGIGISEIPVLKWTLPEGFAASEFEWPIPHRAPFIGMTSYGYLDTNYFSTSITPPADLPAGSEVAITLNATWQICEEGCKSESAEFTVTLPVKAAAEPNPEVADALASYAKSHMPGDTPETWEFTITEDGEQITIIIKTGAALPEDLFFFDYDAQVDPQSRQEWTAPENGIWQLVVPRNKGNDISATPGPFMGRLKGILAASDTLPGAQRPGVWIDVPFDERTGPDFKTDATPSTPGSAAATGPAQPDSEGIITLDGTTEKAYTFWTVLPFAFLGGLILNLMPCVFPVLGIKIMGFVQQAGEDKSKVKFHGLVFTGGVVASMLVLAGILIAINAAGGQSGWGFQLQSPGFLAAILILFFVFGLNLAGLFELGTSLTGVGGGLQQKKGFSGSFFSGLLTTLVATPCSGPFLGPVMGFTLNQPALNGLAIFTVFALGIASPYLILSFFPDLIQKLPRPGAWMVTFKKFMAFPMFATVVFFMNAYFGMTGKEGAILLLGAFVAYAFGLWIYGHWCPLFRPKRSRIVGGVFALAFVGLGVLMTGHSIKARPPERTGDIAMVTHGMEWQRWSPGRVNELRQQGMLVYVDFTADW